MDPQLKSTILGTYFRTKWEERKTYNGSKTKIEARQVSKWKDFGN